MNGAVRVGRADVTVGTVSGLQEGVLSTPGAQIAATVAVGLAIAVGTWILGRVADAARTRYGQTPAEAIETTGLIGAIALSIPALAFIWQVPYILDFLFGLLTLDRWTAIKQLITIAAFAIAYLGSRVINRSIDALENNDSITEHQSSVAYHVVDVGAIAVASAVALALWGVDLGRIFIGAGAITAVMAFAARSTFAAVIGGFMLLLARPFRVGDWVTVDGRTGIVTDVTIFNTKLRTAGDEHVLVPNDKVTEEQYANLSENDQIRVTLEVGVDYDSDLETVESVLEETAEGIEMVKESPAPHVVATNFGDSAIVFETRVWISQPSVRRINDVKSELILAIKAAFEREGISIPFPQRVHDTRERADVAVEMASEQATVAEADD
jgi:small-conductance mechanosensitive channel